MMVSCRYIRQVLAEIQCPNQCFKDVFRALVFALFASSLSIIVSFVTEMRSTCSSNISVPLIALPISDLTFFAPGDLRSEHLDFQHLLRQPDHLPNFQTNLRIPSPSASVPSGSSTFSIDTTLGPFQFDRNLNHERVLAGVLIHPKVQEPYRISSEGIVHLISI